MKVACDIETSCGVETCEGFGLSNSSKCEHAVHFKQNKIDIIGVWDGTDYHLFSTPSDFDRARIDRGWTLIFHGGKFDFKTLKEKGSKLTPADYAGDTMLLGACVAKKVTPEYLKTYNEKRKVLNETLAPGQRHRVGTPLTLKTMAPYYLGVDAFWENPVSHDDPSYNRRDCEYTYQLHEKLLDAARQDGTVGFYEDYLLPWQKLLVQAEYEGVLVNEVLLHRMYADAVKELARLEGDLHSDLADCFGIYRGGLEQAERDDSQKRCADYISKRVKNPAKIPEIEARYAESLATKLKNLPTKFNLGSSQQMLVVCQHHGIDTNVEKRDKATNEWIETEGTDKYVLKRAKVKANNGFAAKLLKYREKETETRYLKQYIDACVGGRIYCTFSIVGTRTGRLSSSGPNLQNVKGSLRAPFIIADPDRFTIYTVDASQIEPRVIAYLTQDWEMVKLFQDGRDYHNYATKKFFPSQTEGVDERDIKAKHSHLRKTAKIGDLSTLYGTGKYTFQTMCLVREEMDIALEECDAMIKTFREEMPGPFEYKEALDAQYRQYGGTMLLKDPFGYIVQPRDMSSIKMTLFNTYVQGFASRMIFHASLMAFRFFSASGIDAVPLLWVHDEVVWRFPKGMEEFCKEKVDAYMKSYTLMTQHGSVPLDVEGHLASCWQK